MTYSPWRGALLARPSRRPFPCRKTVCRLRGNKASLKSPGSTCSSILRGWRTRLPSSRNSSPNIRDTRWSRRRYQQGRRSMPFAQASASWEVELSAPSSQTRQDDISPSRTICGRVHREERGWRSTLNRASFLRAVRSSSRLTAVSASMLQVLGVCARQCSSRNPEANFSPFRQGASHADQISPPAGAVVHKVRRGCQHHHRLPGQELGIRPVNGPEVLCIHGEVDVSDLGGPPACPFENEGLWRSVRFVMRVVVIIRWRSLVKTCTGSDCLDTVLQLRRPFAWHKPDERQRTRLNSSHHDTTYAGICF